MEFEWVDIVMILAVGLAFGIMLGHMLFKNDNGRRAQLAINEIKITHWSICHNFDRLMWDKAIKAESEKKELFLTLRAEMKAKGQVSPDAEYHDVIQKFTDMLIYFSRTVNELVEKELITREEARDLRRIPLL